MTMTVNKTQLPPGQGLEAGGKETISSRIHSYLMLSTYMDDSSLWTERKKVLLRILVWKMEHENAELTEGEMMQELEAQYGPDHLGELLAGMNGTLISYDQGAESEVRITELGKTIIYDIVRSMFHR